MLIPSSPKNMDVPYIGYRKIDLLNRMESPLLKIIIERNLFISMRIWYDLNIKWTKFNKRITRVSSSLGRVYLRRKNSKFPIHYLFTYPFATYIYNFNVKYNITIVKIWYVFKMFLFCTSLLTRQFFMKNVKNPTVWHVARNVTNSNFR